MVRYLLAFVGVLCALSTANAAVTGYTDRASFTAALGGAPTTTINFDGVAAGAVIPNGGTFDGVGFDFSDLAYDLIVLDGLDTTSPPNFLGVDDGSPYGPFLGGDTVTLTFPTPVFAVGVSFLAPGGLYGGAFHVVTPEGTADSGASPTFTFGSGDEEWFVGLIADTPFATADFTSDDDIIVSNNLDDITYAAIPEPVSAALVVSGVAGIFAYRRRGSASDLGHHTQEESR